MLIVVGDAPRMPVLPVSVIMGLIAIEVIVRMAMVDYRCLALMRHERRLDNSRTDVPAARASCPCRPPVRPESPVRGSAPQVSAVDGD